jgi:hypothetical protein
MLKELAQKEATAIVATFTKHKPNGATLAPSRRQFAPKASWLALGRGPHRRTVTGQLADGLGVAEGSLTSGPAERAVLTKLMVDAFGWSRNTASSCISRLIAAGRLTVAKPPNLS